MFRICVSWVCFVSESHQKSCDILAIKTCLFLRYDFAQTEVGMVEPMCFAGLPVRLGEGGGALGEEVNHIHAVIPSVNF